MIRQADEHRLHPPGADDAQCTLTCISGRNAQSGHRFLYLTAQIHHFWGQKDTQDVRGGQHPLQYQLWFLRGCWGGGAGKLSSLSAVLG